MPPARDTFTDRALAYLEPHVLFHTRKYAITGMTRDDVAQELRIHLWKKLERYDPADYSLLTWAYRVIRNKLTDMNRGVYKKNMDVLDTPGRYELIDKIDQPQENWVEWEAEDPA